VDAVTVSTNSSSQHCLRQVKAWLDRCQYHYSPDKCGSRDPKQLPTRVIRTSLHTDNVSLHETSDGEIGTYAALSYCWGLTRTFTATFSSLSNRKARISLNDLPRNIRNAVEVARVLDIPYIWVGSLCIIQNTLLDWQMESSRMCFV
jgi:hypothetical protein